MSEKELTRLKLFEHAPSKIKGFEVPAITEEQIMREEHKLANFQEKFKKLIKDQEKFEKSLKEKS